MIHCVSSSVEHEGDGSDGLPDIVEGCEHDDYSLIELNIHWSHDSGVVGQ